MKHFPTCIFRSLSLHTNNKLTKLCMHLLDITLCTSAHHYHAYLLCLSIPIRVVAIVCVCILAKKSVVEPGVVDVRGIVFADLSFSSICLFGIWNFAIPALLPENRTVTEQDERNKTNGIAHKGIERNPKVCNAHFGVTFVKNCRITSGRAPAKSKRPVAAAVRADNVPAGGYASKLPRISMRFRRKRRILLDSQIWNHRH